MVLQVEKFTHDLMQMSIKFQRNQMELIILLFLEPRRLLGTA